MVYVIKNKVRSYDCYWNETKQKYTGLLDATMYGEETDTLPYVKDGEVISYDEVIGLKESK